jgi:rare lipoprotein A
VEKRAIFVVPLLVVMASAHAAAKEPLIAAICTQDRGSQTASGEAFSPLKLTAAHRTLPFGTMVRVTNLYNSRTVVVRINDRGPFTRSRIIDLTPAAAKELRFSGLAPVRVEVVPTMKVEAAPAPNALPLTSP